MQENVVAGIDIGGTKTAVALAAPSGAVLAKRRLPTRADGFETVEQIFEVLAQMLGASGARLSGVGIACPSPLDLEKGLVMAPSNLLEWNNFPIIQLFTERFNVPVTLENDANAAALGEFSEGAGRGFQNILYVTVSTGIGGGIIFGGEIYHGVGAGAGELGHTIVKPDGFPCNCGSRGCVETICAGVHIARRARERLAAGTASLMNEMAANFEEVSAKTVVDAARRGDQLAVEIWDETCRYLALGIANAITLLAPEAVVIGGGIAAASGEMLFEPLRRLVPQYVSMIPRDQIKILPAALGGESGLCGALLLARKAGKIIYANVS